MQYIVDIDFEEASKEWMRNKRHTGGGTFAYRCMHYSKTKQKYTCKKTVKPRNDYCRYHCKHGG